MDEKITYLKNLVHLAQANKELHPREKACILEVAHKLGVEAALAEQIMNEPLEPPPLPSDPLIKYSLLSDLLNLAACDGVIGEEELDDCRRVATSLDFDPSIIDHLAQVLRHHLDHGYHKNAFQALISESLHAETIKNHSHDKYD
ncbi:MAG: hypothetical protein ACP5O2_08720 [Bacteroidales bacterium]